MGAAVAAPLQGTQGVIISLVLAAPSRASSQAGSVPADGAPRAAGLGSPSWATSCPSQKGLLGPPAAGRGRLAAPHRKGGGGLSSFPRLPPHPLFSEHISWIQQGRLLEKPLSSQGGGEVAASPGSSWFPRGSCRLSSHFPPAKVCLQLFQDVTLWSPPTPKGKGRFARSSAFLPTWCVRARDRLCGPQGYKEGTREGCPWANPQRPRLAASL